MTRGRDALDGLWRLVYRVAYPAFALYCKVVRPRIVSAYVVVRRGGAILVVRHSYKRGVGVPAGMAERGESPRECASRELREEVGLSVEPSALRPAVDFVSSRELPRDHVHVFEVDADESWTAGIDGREIVWAGFRSIVEVRGLSLRPVCREALERIGLLDPA